MIFIYIINVTEPSVISRLKGGSYVDVVKYNQLKLLET